MSGIYSRYSGLGGGAAAGTVTSVGLADGSSVPIYSISGSPVTTTGTLTFTLMAQAANLILAGPTSGGSAQPGFRSLVAADLPALSYVTSVGLALPSSILTVSGSPVTSSGTLTGSLATQTANTVWAGATSGGAAQPTFRALVAADLPLTFGNLTDAGTDGIVVTGGTGAVIGSGTSLAQHVADTTHNGYLSSTDWNTFNGKTSGGITALTGDVTASGPGSVAATLAATSNATLLTLSALTSASSLATVGTVTTGTWNATTVAVNHGGTGVTSVTTAPATTAWAGWDANKNLTANNLIDSYTTTSTAAGTTTLVVGSTYQQFFTGTLAQNCKLPATSTLVTGMSFLIANNSTNTVTVQTATPATLQAMGASTVLIVTCVSTASDATSSWSFLYLNSVGQANTALSNLSSTSINASLVPSASGSIDLGSASKLWNNIYANDIFTLIVYDGSGITVLDTNNRILKDASGNAQLTFTATGLTMNAQTANTSLYLNGSKVVAGAALGASGTVLTSNGTTSAPTYQALPSPSLSYFSGSMPQATYWGTTSSTFVDPTVEAGSNTLTTIYSAGLTVTAGASNLPSITFTPPTTTAAYQITASFNGANAGSADAGGFRLTDGSTAFAWQVSDNPNFITGSPVYPTVLTGLYKPGTTSAVTVKIQVFSNGGAGTMFLNGLQIGTTPGLVWNVVQIAP